MEYLYFVAYNTPTGSGNSSISSDEPIDSLENIRTIEDILKKQNDEDNLALTNWKLLKQSKEV